MNEIYNYLTIKNNKYQSFFFNIKVENEYLGYRNLIFFFLKWKRLLSDGLDSRTVKFEGSDIKC